MHDFVIRDLPTTWAPSYDVFRGNVLMHDFVIRDLPTTWAPSYDVLGESMHSYLRAIGFSKCKTRKQLEKIYATALRDPNRKMITTISIDTSLIQFEKDFGPSFGLSLIGEYGIEGDLSIEHYYPYIKGSSNMDIENIYIEKQTDKESYAGVCEDSRLGMTLIFYLQNISDYAKSKWFNYSNKSFKRVRFSALSTQGTILLGIKKTKMQKITDSLEKSYRDNLMYAVKKGDKEALEYYAHDEIQTYRQIVERLKSEDILSIIDTTIMPCGVECDHYSVTGNIISVREEKNSYTDETVYNLLIETYDVLINVGINSIDLEGEPLPGRRFRGEIWLQGYVKI